MAETASLVIRFARLREADVIAAMSRNLIEQDLQWRYRPGRIRHLILDKETTVIVAETVVAESAGAGRIDGFAVLTFGLTTAHLNLLAVEPRKRRSGIAVRMLNWLTESCQVAGLGRINLEVRENNLNAINFYKARGYELVGRHRGYYDGVEHAVLMSHQLIPESREEHRPR